MDLEQLKAADLRMGLVPKYWHAPAAVQRRYRSLPTARRARGRMRAIALAQTGLPRSTATRRTTPGLHQC